jgi:predicted nucleic acid-binding protein
MILIDTSVWIEFLRCQGDPVIKRRVAAYVELGEAAYCGPVEFELLSGARPKERLDVESALGFSEFLVFSRACWQRAAEMERKLRAKGVTVPRDDVFVAAAAIHHGVAVYSLDPHFVLMRDKGAFGLQLV